MNMIMDSGHAAHPIPRGSPLHESSSPSPSSPQHHHHHHPHGLAKDLQISTTPPTPPNEDSQHPMSPRTPTVNTKTTLKRSFDVAFLMMPDERLKSSQPQVLEKQKMPLHQYQPPLNKQPNLRQYPQITARTPRIYDDPTLVISPADWESHPLKSAFTKVASRLESPGQPAPPLSPDQLSCPSMSPPMATTPPRSASGSSSDIISIDSLPSSPAALSPPLGYQNFRPDYSPNGAFQSVQNFQTQRLKQQFLYRGPMMNPTEHPTAGPPPPSSPPGFIPVYPGFPFPPNTAPGMPHPFGGLPPPEMMPRMVQNPAAAAILSTLIPPTLASTFTLTAQNVCAKCNISFRMTSDLVYHMRSHHKSEVATDPNRRKREEKLKCPVCQETFRERHHLTRHMTAHQDKASDQTGANPTANTASIQNNSNDGGPNNISGANNLHQMTNSSSNASPSASGRMNSQRSSSAAAYSK
ncbi:uncharacterized protein LOC142234473 [Haematobia irritans]|uniref:uncharacterized protein LOC142234473 n=1 Tax=Haematobia irritans TaxID=7368 RepID=UPI003F4F50D7